MKTEEPFLVDVEKSDFFDDIDTNMGEMKFRGLLELSCSVLGFEVGEVWQVKNFKQGKATH